MASRWVFIMVVLLAGSTAIGGEIYRWVDESGQVHFGDRPAGTSASRVAAPPAHRVDTDLQQRYQKRRKLLNAFQEEHEQERQEELVAREEAMTREKNCTIARDTLRAYLESATLYRLDEKGNRVNLSDAERTRAESKAREDVTYWCG